jgi:predicted HAD superfamily Cof-like phosphohydrolase
MTMGDTHLTVRQVIDLVRDFHTKFAEPIADAPVDPDKGLLKFRAEVVLEELLELVGALGFNVTIDPPDGSGVRTVDLQWKGSYDPVKTVDAMRDLEYVLAGTELALGLQDVREETFLAVHTANMTKQLTEGVNKKIAKPPGWKPPDIGGILRRRFPTKRLMFR